MFYDPISRKVKWLFNSDTSFDGATYTYRYDRELILDTVLQAFYTNTISPLASNSPYVSGYFITPSIQAQNVVFNLVDSSNDRIIDSSSNNVIIDTNVAGAGSTSTKFLTEVYTDATTTKYTFSEYVNSNFLDWYSNDSTGITYLSYLITGYELYGDTMRNKRVPYIITHFGRTETGFELIGGEINYSNPSSCMLQARWEWTTSSTPGRWSTAQQVYRYNIPYIPDDVNDTLDYGYSVITTKNRIRGYGKALSLYFYSEVGKDLYLLGWGTDVSGNSVV